MAGGLIKSLARVVLSIGSGDFRIPFWWLRLFFCLFFFSF